MRPHGSASATPVASAASATPDLRRGGTMSRKGGAPRANPAAIPRAEAGHAARANISRCVALVRRRDLSAGRKADPIYVPMPLGLLAFACGISDPARVPHRWHAPSHRTIPSPSMQPSNCISSWATRREPSHRPRVRSTCQARLELHPPGPGRSGLLYALRERPVVDRDVPSTEEPRP